MTRKQIGAVLGAVVLAVALAVLTTSGTHAQSYKPTFGYTVTTPTGGASSNTSNTIIIPAPDYNYEDSSLYTFTPIDGWSATGDVVAIADGMGNLSASVHVGLLGGPCSTNLPPSFLLENASVDASVVIPPGSSADPPGTNNMYWVLKPAATYPVPVAAYDPNIPDYLEAMPHFINDMLDPDGAGPKPPLQPRARYAGFTTVAGMNIILQFIVLNPGQIAELGGIKAQMGPELGHPSFIVLDNPVSPEESPGAISDFCTPLNTVTGLFATTTANPYDLTGGGTVARTNPPTDTGVLGTGTHMARNYSQSERDADGDGHENDLDPCHFTPEPLWDPRAAVAAQPGLDTDGDGIPDSCDPTPAISNIDEDADGYNNRQDNCALVPNGCTVASCSPAFPPIYSAAWDNLADDDGFEPNADVGPGPDSIGNACDDSDCDGVEDGAVTPCSCADGIDNGPDGTTDGNDPDCAPDMDKGELLAATDPWGANPGTGQFYHAMPWTAMALTNDAGTADTDGDGYSDALEVLLGSDPTDAETGTECDDAADNDGDTKVNDGCPAIDNAEEGAECDDALDENTQVPNDEGDAAPDKVNDGCPAIPDTPVEAKDSMPESLVIDATLTVGAGTPPRSGGFPSPDVPQSCNDGIDNDGDTKIDLLVGIEDNDDLGCDPTDDSYDGDADHDGVANDGTDNCPAVKNPEQTNTDNDCGNDVDDDGDTNVNDGCPAVGAPEDDACVDALDDEEDGPADGIVNDGCPMKGSFADCDLHDGAGGDPDGDCDDAAFDGDPDETVLCANAIDDDGDTRVNDGCPAVGVSEEDNDECAEDPAVDDDGDGKVNDGCPAKDDREYIGDACDSDDDNDGFDDDKEWWAGTDPFDDCTDVPGSHDAWPLDQNIDKSVTVVGDVLKYAGNVGASVGSSPPTSWSLRRLDLNADGSITVVGDVLKYAGNVGSSCT